MEALRGKVEVERVMGRLRVERRVLWGVGSGQLLGGDEGGGDAVAEGR